ncbi:uncharacterized protein [Diadema antillarum]|uniref:uncharacterized protein n=1 Tax=Diadema antillarum TaxID=105358 RepID=UPI003A84D0E5
MSATLVQRNSTLTDVLTPGSPSVSIISPVMAVSVCRPVLADGLPSHRGGSGSQRSRASSARSLPSHIHFKGHNNEAESTSLSLSSSVLQPYPPINCLPSGKDILTLPKIPSSSKIYSSESLGGTATIDAADASHAGGSAPLDTPNPPSIFPNFRALQRLAASAKLRINSLKSKEAKAVTAMLIQEKNGGVGSEEASLGNQSSGCILQDNAAQSKLHDLSRSSQQEDSVQYTLSDINSTAQHDDDGPSISGTKVTRFKRSRSRRRGRKTPARKKKSSPSLHDEDDVLGNFNMVSTVTLNNRWENKKFQTFSTKYNKKFTSKAKVKNHAKNSNKSGKGMAPVEVAETTNVIDSITTPFNEQQKSANNGFVVGGAPTPRMVLEQAATIYSSKNHVSVRLSHPKNSGADTLIKKVFLSEKQSGTLRDCGRLVPCAPPTSPTQEQLEQYEYVPSLTDLRSQRSLKEKLTVMDSEEKKKRQKQREDRARQEKQMMRSNICALRQRQRLEIYALNKIMTQLEHSQFEKFCESMKKDKK